MSTESTARQAYEVGNQRRFRSPAHRRPFRAAAATGKTGRAVRTLSRGRLRRCGREITMLIDGADPSAAAKSDALLIRARRFHAALVASDGVPFAVLAKREGVSPSYFTRLVRLSYLAPDITQAILDGRQPRELTADKLLAHSRLPLPWHEQRIVLAFT